MNGSFLSPVIAAYPTSAPGGHRGLSPSRNDLRFHWHWRLFSVNLLLSMSSNSKTCSLGHRSESLKPIASRGSGPQESGERTRGCENMSTRFYLLTALTLSFPFCCSVSLESFWICGPDTPCCRLWQGRQRKQRKSCVISMNNDSPQCLDERGGKVQNKHTSPEKKCEATLTTIYFVFIVKRKISQNTMNRSSFHPWMVTLVQIFESGP